MSFEMSNRGFTQWFALTLLSLAMLHVAALPAAAETPSDKADALLSRLIKPTTPAWPSWWRRTAKFFLKRATAWQTGNIICQSLPETTFRIGPVTKQFTAAAILKLQEEGKLNVDDKLSKYIPDFPRGRRGHSAPIADPHLRHPRLCRRCGLPGPTRPTPPPPRPSSGR